MVASLFRGSVPIIDDETLTDPRVRDMVYCPTVNGEIKGHGYVERDYSTYPQEMFDSPSEMDVIPESEWDERIKMQDDTKSSLQHLREVGADGQPIKSLDQNGNGYCWAYSTGMCVQMLRVIMGSPYVRMNPHSVASIIKRGADQGGWCGLSAKFLREYGIAPEGLWPLHSRDYQRHYNEAMKVEMAKYKVLEDWYDLAKREHSQYMTLAQVYTCLLLNIPVAVDFNWWAHSVCALRVVKVEAGSHGLLIINSWTDSWGDRGLSVLRGQKGVPNGAVGLRRVVAPPPPTASERTSKPRRRRAA